MLIPSHPNHIFALNIAVGLYTRIRHSINVTRFLWHLMSFFSSLLSHSHSDAVSTICKHAVKFTCNKVAILYSFVRTDAMVWLLDDVRVYGSFTVRIIASANS